MEKLDARSIGGYLASLSWVALRSFLGTALVVGLAGVLLASLSYYAVRHGDWVLRFLAVVLVLIEALAVGLILGTKRAVSQALVHGLGVLQLGRLLVHLVFDRVLGVSGVAGLDTQGGQIVQAIQRMPLAQAEEALSGAIRAVMGDTADQSWLRRKIQQLLLNAVRKYSLARLRTDGTGAGGIDLVLVREELERNVDAALAQKVRGEMRFWNLLAGVGWPLIVAVQTWMLLVLPRGNT